MGSQKVKVKHLAGSIGYLEGNRRSGRINRILVRVNDTFVFPCGVPFATRKKVLCYPVRVCHCYLMSKQEMRVRVGVLAKERRGELGMGAVRFAEAAGIGSDRTVKSFEAGLTTPDVVTQRKLENALGWRRGVIRDLLKAGDEGTVAPADIDMQYVDGWEPATRASELEDAEVLAEAIKRLERWQKLLHQDPPADVSAEQPIEEQAQVYLAAHAHGKAAKMRPVKPTKDEL